MNYHFVEETTISSPALVYYEDVIRENIIKACTEAGSAEKLWPHVKTHKSQKLTEILLEHGIDKFKCATIAEAEMVAQTEAKNILLAYPLIGPNIEKFLKLVKRYPNKKFYALGDNLECLSILGKCAQQNKTSIDCFVDVNTGMNRTGVDWDQIVSFYKQAAGLPGIKLIGMHCYDGERHEQCLENREEKVKITIQKVKNIQKELKACGLLCDILIMGGSPTFPCYARDMKESYFSPGTIFVYDEGYKKQFPDLPYQAGAAVMTRVISHPADGYFTLDAGYKAISAEQGMRGKLIGYPNAEEAFQSEEHWTFRMKSGFENERPHIGEILYVIPWHICPTTAMYDEVAVVSGKSLKGYWKVTARARKIYC